MKKKGFELPDWVPQDLWDEWFDWRKKRKFPVSERVKRHCLKMLEDHRVAGYTAESVLRTALVRGWRDLWEPKGEPKRNLVITHPEQLLSEEEFEYIKRETARIEAKFKAAHR